MRIRYQVELSVRVKGAVAAEVGDCWTREEKNIKTEP